MMPIIESLAIACLIYAAFYFIFALAVTAGIRRVKPRGAAADEPAVSVVVCARNEERDIKRCLEHLAALDYPAEKLELIIVDDESEDSTASIIAEFAADDSRFIALSTKDAVTNLPAKQRPLDMGIRHAKGTLILVTDADIAVRPGWIKAHVAAYDDTIGIAGGITRIDTSSGRGFDNLINLDQVSKLSVAMGCAGLGVPLTVMGNNLSFRREAYIACGGFEGFTPSIVEDMALMNAIIHDTDYTLGWVAGDEGVVESTPEDSLDAFLNQRRRWVHELGDLSFIGKLMIGIEAVMAVVFVVMLSISLFVPHQFIAVCVVWNFAYMLLLKALPGSKRRDSAWILPMLLFQLYYSAVFVLKGFGENKNVVWKGRVYGKS